MRDLCKPREVKHTGVRTPLIVPSFSTVESRDIESIHSAMRDRLGFASLVSAYDIHNKAIQEENVWKTELVFIDSGNYENDVLNGGSTKLWDKRRYELVLDSIRPKSRVVVVNFDQFGQINNQISDAISFFDNYCYAHDFLCKPKTKNSKKKSESQINHLTIATHAKQLAQFDIVGFTEKELGESLKERCQQLVQLRTNLGPDLPIHIFGCIDPLGMIAYLLCGADIFDGLGWLRYGIHDGLAVYRNNYAMVTRGWGLSEVLAYRLMLLMNLRALKVLSARMRRFATSHSLDELGLNEPLRSPLKALMSEVGIEVY